MKNQQSIKSVLNFILMSILLMTSINGYGCDCKSKLPMDSARYNEFINSDLIFIGDVIEINTEEKYAILEPIVVFKSAQDPIEPIKININKYCEPVIYSKGKWLIYASYFGKELMINVCGLSRSFEKPDENRYFRLLPPPPPLPPAPGDTAKIETTEYIIPEHLRLENRKIAITELEKEVKLLEAKN